MSGRYKKSNYRIIDSFVYKGPDGSWPQKQWVRLGPGEECPNFDCNEAQRWLTLQKISEVSDNGENIPYKKIIEMNAEEIERVFSGKNPQTIRDIIAKENFGKDTLTLLLIYIEKMKISGVKEIIEQKLNV